MKHLLFAYGSLRLGGTHHKLLTGARITSYNVCYTKLLRHNGVAPTFDHCGVFAQIVHRKAGLRAVPPQIVRARQELMVRPPKAQ